MLHLILGPAGTGKTSLLYQQIEALAKAKKPSILLVPEQFTSSTEGRIYHTLGDEGSGMVESLSFTSLAERILSACGGAALPTLSDAGRAVLVRRAMTELGEKVRHYRRHRRSAAFCSLAAETIDEFKSAGITPAQLTELSAGCGAGREKLEELALIYGAYEALLAHTGMDPADRLTRAADRLESALGNGQVPEFLQDRAIFIDEFDTFNAPKKRLLTMLLATAPDVTVALCADGQPVQEGDLGLLSGGRKLALNLRQLARKAGVSVAPPLVLTEDLRHQQAPGLAALTHWLESEEESEEMPANPEEIRLYAASDREAEARAVAAAIRHLVQAGVRYRDMAVVCRNTTDYQAAIRYEFRLAGIPLYCDETTTPEFCAPACAVKALLGLVRGMDYNENMTVLAKTGLCDLTERQVCALDNYVYTWSPRRADWQQPFARSPQGFGETSRVTDEEKEDVELAEQARQKLQPAIDKLRARAKEADAATLSKALYLCLKELGAEECQQRQIDQLRRREGIPAAQEAAREWNIIMQLLNQMSGLLGDEVLNGSEYAELFQLLLRSSDLGHIPQMQDAVIFTSAGKMRLDDPDYVFVLGLAENEFPQPPGDRGLLTHADRDGLMAQEVDLPDSFESRVVREQICFYKALTAARKGLWLSWPEGQALPLTGALEQLRAIGLKEPTLEPLDYAATPAAALDRLGGVWTLDNQETANLYAALSQQPDTSEVLAALRRTAQDKPFAIMDTETMAQMLGNAVRISPSQMEKYYSCHYSYFLQYVLGLRPRQKAELTPNQSGSLMHWVLQMALDPQPGLYSDWKPAPLAEMTDEQCAELASRLTDEYVRLYMPDSSARFAYLIRRLKRSLSGLLCYLRDEQAQGGFAPAACELGIGKGAGCMPPQIYRLPNGRTVEIIGTVDRADTWTDKDGQPWVRVVDYKTGTKSFDLKEVYCGLDCQMLLYLFTLTKDETGRFTGAKPAGVLYLLADGSPAQVPRDAGPAPVCKLDGLVSDLPRVYHAMDTEESGKYVPFDFQNGKPNPRKKKYLADGAKMERIAQHMETMVTEMAEGLYAGRIEAEPLCTSSRDSCRFCDFALICRHEKGFGERGLEAPSDPFGEPKPQPEETTNEAPKEVQQDGGN